MDKNQLLEKIKLGNYSKEQLLGWVNALPNIYSNSRKPSINKKGDVYMHSIFHHPYILLEFKNNVWICGLLTSESTCPEVLEECNSRFFAKESYFTKTLFTASEIQGSFVNNYDNNKHLKEVLIKLKNILL